ncbi:hypothetical protein EJ08DRAFT_736249 [Tothia fuscella]|uniref:Uncharacterized protein n=1 Tax=Tothia fuscella TaxID=1048955 RepID=A0A9P4NLT8_9PEZI|nr:hypothetical protein EJ08DRAFT_736249 [Tothia fuscella]
MAGIVSNIIQNSIGGFVSGAVTTAGGYAGDAVGGLGNLIEGAGASVGNKGIAGRFDAVGSGINSYGNAIKNATAPNAGSAIATKKTTVKKTDSKPAEKALPSSKPAAKALPAPGAKKAITAGGEKIKTPYTPPSSVKKIEPAKKVPVTAKKDTASTRSIPPYNPPSGQQKPLYPDKSTAPVPPKDNKPALPASGYTPSTKAGSVAGSVKPYSSTVTGKKAPSVVGGSADKAAYKPAIPGYGDKAKPAPPVNGYTPSTKAGSVVGAVKPSLPNYSSTVKKAPSVVGPAGKGGYKPAVAGYGDKSKSQAGSVAGSVAGGPSFF